MCLTVTQGKHRQQEAASARHARTFCRTVISSCGGGRSCREEKASELRRLTGWEELDDREASALGRRKAGSMEPEGAGDVEEVLSVQRCASTCTPSHLQRCLPQLLGHESSRSPLFLTGVAKKPLRSNEKAMLRLRPTSPQPRGDQKHSAALRLQSHASCCFCSAVWVCALGPAQQEGPASPV